MKCRRWVLLLALLITPLFPTGGHAQEKKMEPAPETQAGETPPRPTETDLALDLTERFHERLVEIQEEQKSLEERLQEGLKELDTEAQRVPSFLEIEEITAEEYQPYLEKWERMRSSYASVLEDVNDRLDEVGQAKIRIESKLRLWSLRDDELRIKVAELPKGSDDSELKAQREAMKKVIASYEAQKDLAEEVLRELGQNKTVLIKSLDLCNDNYAKLSKRWEQIRFTRLKFRQQPKFSQESFVLALHELGYRVRDLPTYRSAIFDFFVSVKEAMKRKFLRTFLFGVGLFALALLFRQIKKSGHKYRALPENATILERFANGMVKILDVWAWGLYLLGAFGLIFVAFSELQEENVGLFLLCALSGAYATWFVVQIIRLLLRGLYGSPRLLTVSDGPARGLFIHGVLLAVSLYFFVMLSFAGTLLKYESEGSRLVKWLLEILIFGLIFSVCRHKWLSELTPTTRLKSLNFFRPLLRFFTFLILVLVIGLDGMGYTYLSDYLAESSLKSLGLIPLLLFLRKGLVELIDYRLFSKGLSRFNMSQDLLLKWKKTLRQWTFLGFWAAFLFGILTIWDLKPEFYAGLKKFSDLGISVGSINVTIGLLFSVFLAFYVSILISRLIRAVMERNIYPRKKWDLGVRNALSTGIHYILVLIGFMIALRLLGFDLKNITVLAGAFGVGLGFGLQNLANNFASGIVLLIERPVKVGDVIQIGNTLGKVRKIGARSTSIETPEQSTLLVPNGELLSSQVTNWTYNSAVAGSSIAVGVAYGSNVEKVKEILLKAAQNHPDVAEDPKPEVEFSSFGDSSLNFSLKFWVKDIRDRLDTKSEIMFVIEKAFQENRIEIPFPHRVVTMRSEPPSS